MDVCVCVNVCECPPSTVDTSNGKGQCVPNFAPTPPPLPAHPCNVPLQLLHRGEGWSHWLAAASLPCGGNEWCGETRRYQRDWRWHTLCLVRFKLPMDLLHWQPQTHKSDILLAITHGSREFKPTQNAAMCMIKVFNVEVIKAFNMKGSRQFRKSRLCRQESGRHSWQFWVVGPAGAPFLMRGHCNYRWTPASWTCCAALKHSTKCCYNIQLV